MAFVPLWPAMAQSVNRFKHSRLEALPLWFLRGRRRSEFSVES